MTTCQYCSVIAAASRTTCSQCGAPLRLPEKPTIVQRVTYPFRRKLVWAEGIDVSKWQGLMDWSVARPKIDYAIIKASENVWEDNQYFRNISGCEQYNIVYGVYHFCRPEYDWRAQAEFFADRVSGIMPAVADVERTGGLNPVALADWVHAFVDHVRQLSGQDIMIYTRASFWDRYVAPSPWSDPLYHWAAHYNPYITEPNIPQDWTSWQFWQWSADGNGKGHEYGAESNSIDLNRFNGTSDEFYVWAGVTPPPPPPSNECVQYSVGVPVLNVRTGPGTNYPIVDQITMGTIVDVNDLGGVDVWIEIEPGKWCAHTYKGAQYMNKV